MNMSKFIDREQEMQTLVSEYRREGSSFVIMYGRRRVGKTTLISEFIKDKNALYFLSSQEPETQNRNLFKDTAAEFINSDLLHNATVSDWDTIFKAIIETKFDKKPIIVIDEFQYIGKSNNAFPSIMQRIWDGLLKDKSLMLILCGSLITMMEEQTLSYSSPLYGRRTAQIRLKQIPFAYYENFFPNKKRKDLIEMYSVTGGVPKYIESFRDEIDIYSAIKKYVLNPSSYLYNEPHFLLQQEVTEIGSYFSLIKTIAAGNSKLSAIATALELPQTRLTKYLKTLIDLDILERRVPVTEENPDKSKKGLYKIKDNFIKFWFAFIYPNLSSLESGNAQIVMDKIKKGFISGQVSYVYEDVCRQEMWQMNADKIWPFTFSKLGGYWSNNTEIDIAALDPEGKNLILGECKYWKEPVGINILSDLEEKAKKIPWNKSNRKVWYVLFSINGFTPELKSLSKTRTNIILAE